MPNTPKALRALLWLAILLLSASTAPAQPRGLPELRIPDGFGVNIHFTRADQPQLDLLGASGNRFIRMDFAWGGIERARGAYNFSAYDRLVADMSQRGIRCLFILDYSNRLYDDGLSPHTDEGRAAFARWAAAGARHFAGKGILWEIWNEPNIPQFWKPTPNAEHYSKLAHAAIDAIRAADPDAFIMAPASSTFPWDFFETMGKHGVFKKLDAVSVHPYRQSAPETAEADYARLRILLDRHAPGKNLPIVSGEWGYSTAWGGMDDEKQANYLVRQRLLNLWMGVPLSIWYDWHDDGPDPREPEHHFGTVYRDFKPKPSYIAGKALAETLDGFRFVRRMAIGSPKDYVMLLARDKRAAIAAWTTAEPHPIRLDLPARQFTLVSRDGQPKAVEPDNNSIQLQLGPAPQYLLFDDSPETPILIGQPAASMILLNSSRAQTVPLLLQNPGRGELSTRVHASIDNAVIGEAELSVKPGQSRTLDVQLSRARRDQLSTLARIELGSSPAHDAWIWLLRTDPLFISVLPVVNDHVTVLLDNPSGQPVETQLRISAAEPLGSPSLRLATGATQGMASLQSPKPLSDDQPIVVEAVDRNGAVIARPEPIRWRQTASLASADHWQATLGGDAKVAGAASDSLVDLADPPQPGLSRALRIDYQFASGWKYAPVRIARQHAAIQGKPRLVGMWIDGNASGDILRCTIRDTTGQVFQHTHGPITWTGWKWITMPLDGTHAGHWAGANDGVIHYPIQWESPVLIDGARRKVDQPLSLRATGFAVGY